MNHSLAKIISGLILATSFAAEATEGLFKVHEWGTFTSAQGSNGAVLGGMSHEDEKLPNFIVSRNLFATAESTSANHPCRPSKGEPVCGDEVVGQVLHSSSVTQKMETPVIYFHSDRARDVAVDVQFPNGIISQYYPRATVVRPDGGPIQALNGGYAHFDVQVLMHPTKLPDVPADSVYAPARQVDSNFVRSGDQNEKFIFYRGLGDFRTDVRVTSQDNGYLTVSNDSDNDVPATFLFDVRSDGGYALQVGAISAHSSRRVNLARIYQTGSHDFYSRASSLLIQALVQSGLYRDEAEAMTNTWKNSYFGNPGLRVLYILSRAETDRLLPLTIHPEPQELVRTLVGRIEILTNSEESRLLTQLANDQLKTDQLGRFAEPKLRRLQQLGVNAAQAQRLNTLIHQVQ